mgnify:CR=1 FL=1
MTAGCTCSSSTIFSSSGSEDRWSIPRFSTSSFSRASRSSFTVFHSWLPRISFLHICSHRGNSLVAAVDISARCSGSIDACHVPLRSSSSRMESSSYVSAQSASVGGAEACQLSSVAIKTSIPPIITISPPVNPSQFTGERSQFRCCQNAAEISVNSYNFALTYIVIYQLSMHDYEFYEFGCM